MRAYPLKPDGTTEPTSWAKGCNRSRIQSAAFTSSLAVNESQPTGLGAKLRDGGCQALLTGLRRLRLVEAPRHVLLVREGELLPGRGRPLVAGEGVGQVGWGLDCPGLGVELEQDVDRVAVLDPGRFLNRLQDANAEGAVSHGHQRSAIGLAGDDGLDLRPPFQTQLVVDLAWNRDERAAPAVRVGRHDGGELDHGQGF